ncbi:MAG: LamG domain-containing protein, partial [Anaerohalosphaera sp.]|nr:LamG domain-containing protein [Anaerohalosphaera sp.]
MLLSWTAGRDAAAHDVYVGESKETLQLLGRIKGMPEATVSGLSAGEKYLWRVDEVTKDGVVETGGLSSFTTSGSLVGYWSLDETADDLAGTRNGAVIGKAKWEDGHKGKAIKLNGKDDFVEIPALNMKTDSMTICAWVRADQQNAQIPGIVFCRADKTVAGINLLGSRLRYHWNRTNKNYDWESGFSMPMDGSWVFVALTVQPHKGVLYLARDGKLEHSEHRIPHQIEVFDGPLNLGRDPTGGRHFKGLIDEVRVFDFALSVSQVDQVRQGQKLDLSGKDKIQLVGADLVDKDQSLEEAAGEPKDETIQKKDTNLLPVAIIILVVIVIAVLSTLRKKK